MRFVSYDSIVLYIHYIFNICSLYIHHMFTICSILCNLGLHIANHVLDMSIELKVQCVCFEKKHYFTLVALNWFPICFY